MRLALVVALSLVTTLCHAQGREHVLPIRYVDRPLTLPQATLRFDQAVVADVTSQTVLNAPWALSAGLTDWLEIGVTYTLLRDPGLNATLRIAHSDVIDAGLRVQVVAPLVTHGDTDLAVSFPVVLRFGWGRIATAVIGELLLASQMEPQIRVPLQLTLRVTSRTFFMLQGSVSLVNRRWWRGDFGIAFGGTPSATALRPIGDVRVGTSLLFGEAGRSLSGFEVTLSFSFFATLLPT